MSNERSALKFFFCFHIFNNHCTTLVWVLYCAFCWLKLINKNFTRQLISIFFQHFYHVVMLHSLGGSHIFRVHLFPIFYFIISKWFVYEIDRLTDFFFRFIFSNVRFWLSIFSEGDGGWMCVVCVFYVNMCTLVLNCNLIYIMVRTMFDYNVKLDIVARG